MAKLTLTDPANFNATTLSQIAANHTLIEAAIENTLSRDGTSPNQMTADLDLNNNDLLNVATAGISVLNLDGTRVYPDTIVTVPILDEDDFVSDSAVHAPSQQSTKAYVGTTITTSLTNLKAATNTWTAKQTFSGAAPLDLTYSEDGASIGPSLNLTRVSATPAASDLLGTFNLLGYDGAGNSTTYVQLRGKINDPTDTSEDGAFEVVPLVAGAQIVAFGVADGIRVGSPTSLYMGTGTINATGYYLNGVALPSLNADGGFTFDTTAEATQAWAIGDQFAGAYRTVHAFETTDTTGVNAGGKSTLAVSRTVTGAGTAGVGLADVAAHFMVQKNDLNGSAVGELDGLKVNVFQNAVTDAGGILVGTYKKVGDGTINEGAVTSMEISTRRFTTDISTYDHWHQNIIGFSPNPTSTWGGRASIGFYSENHQGAGFANFLGITDGASGTAGTMTYLLAGFRERDIATRYFSVDDDGNIESIWLEAGASGGSWKRHKDSASPAANDILWNDYWTGNDSAGNETNYVRMYGAIEDPTNGSEDGSLRILTLVNGSETQQMRIQNGVVIGTSASPLGTNTLNVQTSIAVNGTVRIDSDGGVRVQTTTTTALAAIGNAINTSNKVASKTVWASNNGKLYVALGSAAGDGWQPADSAATIVPA